MTLRSLDDIVENFDLLDNWDNRYQYLMELGAGLDPMPEVHKTDAHRVKGCMSEVYVYAYQKPESASRVFFYGYCDTDIIRGVVAILVELMSNKTVEQILSFDVDDFFNRLKLDKHLSPNRHFGIYGIVELMKKQVGQLV